MDDMYLIYKHIRQRSCTLNVTHQLMHVQYYNILV